MDELQYHLARVGLEVLADYGFALAGGYALQAHQLVDRMSEDIDMFTNRWDFSEFSRAVDAVSEAYRRIGLEVSPTRRADTFARLHVSEPEGGRAATVDLAADARRLDPVDLSIGPVLAERDAVASKVGAVFSRGEARDYIDLSGILDSGRFTREEPWNSAPRPIQGSAEVGLPRPSRRSTGLPPRSSLATESTQPGHPCSRDDEKLRP